MSSDNIGRGERTVTLTCDDSLHLYPTNTPSKFTSHFNPAIEMKGEYEVGLAGIHFTQSWNNIRSGRNSFDFSYTYRNGKKFAISHKIPPAYYPSIQSVINAIMSVYTTTHKANVTVEGLEIVYDSMTKRVRISTDKVTVKILRSGNREGKTNSKTVLRLHGDIARMFGFAEDTLIEGRDVTGDAPATLDAGFGQINVLSDIIYPQTHPDCNIPLLRSIVYDHERDQHNTSVVFNPIHFKSMKKHSVNTIAIELSDERGERLKFEYGRVLVELTFRNKL